MHARNTGHSRNDVSTLDTRRPESSLPHSICHGVMSVVSSRSSVDRSRSLVTLAAEKHGADEHVEQQHVGDVPRRELRLHEQAHGHHRQRQAHADLDDQPQHERALAEDLAADFLVVDRVGVLFAETSCASAGRTGGRGTGRARCTGRRPPWLRSRGRSPACRRCRGRAGGAAGGRRRPTTARRSRGRRSARR